MVVPLAIGRLAGWPVWIALPIAAALPVALLLRRHLGRAAALGKPQILPASLVKQPLVVGAVALTAVVFTTSPGIFAAMSTALQAGVGLTPDRTGLVLAAFPAGVLTASLVVGRMRRQPIDRQLALGALLFALGMLAIRALFGAVEPTPAPFAAAHYLSGLGMGTLVNALFRAVMAASPPADHGAAAGVQQAFQQVGAAPRLRHGRPRLPERPPRRPLGRCRRGRGLQGGRARGQPLPGRRLRRDDRRRPLPPSRPKTGGCRRRMTAVVIDATGRLAYVASDLPGGPPCRPFGAP